MTERFSYDNNVHYPWLHPEPQDCVITNTSPVRVLDCPSYTDAYNLSGQQAAYGWSADKAAGGTGSHLSRVLLCPVWLMCMSALPINPRLLLVLSMSGGQS